MFCPKCGKESRGVCISCLLKEKPIQIKPMKIALCICGRYRYQQLWGRNINESIDKIVKKSIIAPENLRIKDIKTKPTFGENKISLQIELTLEYAGVEAKHVFSSYIKVEKAVCPDCTKIKSTYYEAILQIRTKKPKPEVFIDPRYVSNVEEVKGGFDIYLTSTPYARRLKGDFKKRGYSVKESAKLYGRKDGRDLLRISISVKEPPFEVGDFINLEGKILYVCSTGKRVRCRDISSGQEITFDSHKLQDAEIVAKSSEAAEGVITMVSPNEIQVLDLSDNKTYELKNTGRRLKAGQIVKILKLGELVYIL